MKHTLLYIAITLLLTTVNAQESTQVKLYCDKTESSISYAMNHPLHSWTGVSKEVSSVILADEKRDNITQVAVSVKISSFDSKNANRDSHTMEVTEALLYPNISFSSTSIIQNGDKLEVTGILKFHNVSQTITFEATKEMINAKAKITGEFKVKMTQFNIDPPSLMGMSTKDEFQISFTLLY